MIKVIFPILLILTLFIGIKNIYANGLSGKCSRECAIWAFGKDYQILYGDEFVMTWNKRWGKLFIMRPEDLIDTDMKEVNRLFHASEGL